MRAKRNSIVYLGVLLLIAPILQAQDFAKYRGFSLGTNLSIVLKQSDQKLADVKTIHESPMLIQDLSWWPPSSPEASHQHDSVDHILFSFCNGKLYEISVTYDHSSTEGLTAADMVKSISAEYGPPTSVVQDVTSSPNSHYEAKQKPVASWENSQYSLNLVRSSFSGHFELLIYAKQTKGEVDRATAEAVKLEEQELPEKEAAQRKKAADDLEVVRQKNQKSFHP